MKARQTFDISKKQSQVIQLLGTQGVWVLQLELSCDAIAGIVHLAFKSCPSATTVEVNYEFSVTNLNL